MSQTYIAEHILLTLIIKSAPVPSTSGDNFRKENLSAISAESIYRCMLLFLDHILYRRDHFVRDARSVSRYKKMKAISIDQ